MFPVWPFRTYTVETSNCDPGIDACLAVWRQQFDASQNFIGYVSFSGNYSSSNLDFGEGSQTSNERVSFNTAWDNMDFSSNHYVAKLFHQIESNNQFVCDYTSNLECDISVRVENCQNDVGLWGSPVENCRGTGECKPESWIMGDGFCDDYYRVYGFDFSCYNEEYEQCNNLVGSDSDQVGSTIYQKCPETYNVKLYGEDIVNEDSYWSLSEMTSCMGTGKNCNQLFAETGMTCYELEELYDCNCNGCGLCGVGSNPPRGSGCTDVNSCNYNPFVDIDDGSCIYPDPTTNCCSNTNEDLNGNGPDDCGICGGTGKIQCYQNPNQNSPCGGYQCSYTDCWSWGQCGGTTPCSTYYGGQPTYGGTASGCPDAPGLGGQDAPGCIPVSGCDNTCGSDLVDDECGVCDGTSTTGCQPFCSETEQCSQDSDCSTGLTCNSCGTCSNWNDECGCTIDCAGNYCDNVFQDCLVEDECGVCDGDGIADGACDCNGNVLDCFGDCDGSHTIDACGNCTLPDETACDTDPECGSNYCSGGVCVGDAVLDECNNCNGDAYQDLCSTYYDEDSKPEGYNYGGCADMDCGGHCKRIDNEGVPPSGSFGCNNWSIFYNSGDCLWLDIDIPMVFQANFLNMPLCNSNVEVVGETVGTAGYAEGCCKSGYVDVCCRDVNGTGFCDNNERYSFCRETDECNIPASGCPTGYILVEEGTTDEIYGCMIPGDGNYNELANVDYCRKTDGTVDEFVTYACTGPSHCEQLGNEYDGYGVGSTCDGSCLFSSNFDIIVDQESLFGIGDNNVIISIEGNDTRLQYWGEDDNDDPDWVENFNLGGWINNIYLEYDGDYKDWRPYSYTLEIFDCDNSSNDCSNNTFVSNLLNITFIWPGQNTSTMPIETFLKEGYTYQFLNNGDYATKVTMVDVYGDEYENIKYFTVDSVIDIEQTLDSEFLPWQGIDLDLTNFKNTKKSWKSKDSDGRPALGCFYYDDFNLSENNFIEGKNINYPGGGKFDQLPLVNIVGNPSGDYKFLSSCTDTPEGINCWDIGYQPDLYQPTSWWDKAYAAHSGNDNPPYTYGHWKTSKDCMNAGGCLYTKGSSPQSWNGDYQLLGSPNNLDWESNQTIYVSWWQKSSDISAQSAVGIKYNFGQVFTTSGVFNTNLDTSTAAFNSENDSKSFVDTYYNSEPNKWEKFSFVWQLNNLNIWMMNAELILFAVNISNNTSQEIWFDNFEVREGYDFIPDADVRKVKYGQPVSHTPLQKYWDSSIDYSTINGGDYRDTTAPLEVQLYIYPRYKQEDIFSEQDILYDDYRNGLFFVSRLLVITLGKTAMKKIIAIV